MRTRLSCTMSEAQSWCRRSGGKCCRTSRCKYGRSFASRGSRAFWSPARRRRSTAANSSSLVIAPQTKDGFLRKVLQEKRQQALFGTQGLLPRVRGKTIVRFPELHLDDRKTLLPGEVVDEAGEIFRPRLCPHQVYPLSVPSHQRQEPISPFVGHFFLTL